MVPGGSPIISIGYKYNAWKFLSFIVTDNAGSIQTGLPYLSKYPDQFTNVAICPVACPLVMSKFFPAVNEVDSHNKSSQSNLDLEKFWVTQCGCLRFCMSFSIGINITYCWKLFCYGVKRDHYEKLVRIRELLEQLAQYCFKNTFLPETRTPSNNIHPFDVVYDGHTVYTCRAIYFSSCISPSAAASTISDITQYSA